MSSLASVWDQRKRTLLTNGFIKSFFKDPLKDIVNEILQFYDDMRYWTISSGKPMERFRNCGHCEVIAGPKSMIQNIEFRLMVAPNGYADDHRDKVVLFLSVSKLPADIKYIYVYFVLFCYENKYQHKVTRILQDDKEPDPSTDNAMVKRWRSQFPWATNAVNRSDLEPFESVTFGYYVDILHIAYQEPDELFCGDNDTENAFENMLKYKHSKPGNDSNDSESKPTLNLVAALPLNQREQIVFGFSPPSTHHLDQETVSLILQFLGDDWSLYSSTYWTKGVTVSSHVEFEWVISGSVLEQMQQCHHGQHFYSDNFDGNSWCLYVSPAGWTKDNENLFSFQLKLLQKPYFLAAFFAVFSLETTAFGGVLIEGSKVFHFQKCRSGWSFEANRIEFEEFLKIDRMTITAKIDILAGYDVRTRRRIDPNDWEKYGIINVEGEEKE